MKPSLFERPKKLGAEKGFRAGRLTLFERFKRLLKNVGHTRLSLFDQFKQGEKHDP